MNIAAGIIYVFSFFFVLYSMSSFLQSRKKEFGLLMMQGMSVRQIRSNGILRKYVNWIFCNTRRYFLGIGFCKGYFIIAENVLLMEHL